ncbi:glycosyltransferase family 2 protein [Propionivibrio sp.]|uniref:glycosyltransferase family 2 protein n=1 Tax=Propionivibrio sp. TaxID=2212460 RepID=UPI0039E577C2
MNPYSASHEGPPSSPLVSVCIANYNGMEVIDDCIQSILNQAGSIPLEILVHDDASTDGSVDHIKALYPDVKLIESPCNVGFCIANNRIAAIAKGHYLLLLNNDAALLPDALGTLLAEAQRLGRPAILSLPQYDADGGELLDIGSRLDPFYNPVPNRDPARNDVGMVMGACLWVDRSLWRDLGGFPDWLGSIGEDMYLCCCARLAGHPVRALGTSGYRHRVGRSFGGGKVVAGRLATTFRRRTLSERNKTFVMATTCPAPVVLLLLPLHLASLLLEGGLLSLLKLDIRYLQQIYLPVFGMLFRHGNEIRMSRKATQNNRRLDSADFFAVFDCWPYKLRMLIQHGLPRLK